MRFRTAIATLRGITLSCRRERDERPDVGVLTAGGGIAANGDVECTRNREEVPPLAGCSGRVESMMVPGRARLQQSLYPLLLLGKSLHDECIPGVQTGARRCYTRRTSN